MTKKKTKLDKAVDEISVELDITPKDIRKALTNTFKEIAYVLLIKRKSVMIRGFVKFVLAVRTIKKVKEEFDKLEEHYIVELIMQIEAIYEQKYGENKADKLVL